MLCVAVAASCLATSTNQKPSRSSCWCRRTISRKRRRMRLRMTAPPSRREVMNPACHGPEFSTDSTLNMRYLPRRVTPSRFIRSYCDECVRRRALGNENEPRGAISIGSALVIHRLISRLPSLAVAASRGRPRYNKKSSPESSAEDFSKNPRQLKIRVTGPVIRLIPPAILSS
jgi:hypothetical protein